MENMIKYVFLIIGTMLASLLIYGVVFGDVGRTYMWKGLDQGYCSSWKLYTMHDDTTSAGENLRTQTMEDIWAGLEEAD